jgi:hypothetical protein
MIKVSPIENIEKKYNYRLKAYTIYDNDSISNKDLTGQIFSLRDKYNTIKSIEGTAESHKFTITFNNHNDLENSFRNIINDINCIINEYLIGEGMDQDTLENNAVIFDYSIFSSFIEIRL